MHRDRVLRRKSYVTLLAIHAALSGKLDQEWFSALMEDEELAEALYNRAEAKRQIESIKPIGF